MTDDLGRDTGAADPAPDPAAPAQTDHLLDPIGSGTVDAPVEDDGVRDFNDLAAAEAKAKAIGGSVEPIGVAYHVRDGK